MATKHKNKRTRVKNPHARRTTASPAGTFRMVVAANPGSAVTLAPELDLVKAALLYGDKVTLLSPVTTMFLRVEGLQRFSPRQQIELIRRVGPIISDPAEFAELESGLDNVDHFLRTSARGGSLRDRLLRARLLHQFEPITKQLGDAVTELADQSGVDQLAKARAKGLVQIENADPGDAMDLLVSCITAAKLAETGQGLEDPHTDRIVADFVEKLSRHLSSGREYLVFDEPIANLTEAAVREGLFTPAKGPSGRSAQAMTASLLLGRLPTFPTATVDEILDIRSELAPSLTQFRSAMVTISKTFTSQSWQSGFEDEVHDAWVETVAPAVDAIEASVRDNSSLLARANGLAGFLQPNWPSLMMLGAGTIGHEPVAQVLGAAGQLVPPFLQALRDRQTAASAIRTKPFYFLYAVDRSLS